MNDNMTLAEFHEAVEMLVASGHVLAFLDETGKVRYVHKMHLTPSEQTLALTLEALQKIHAQGPANNQN